MNRVFNKNT